MDAEYGYTIDKIEGHIPVQGYGTCGPDNRSAWYFRAREAHWRLEVYEPGAEILTDPVFCVTGHWGQHYEAGWMPHDLARELIAAALSVYAISAKSEDEDRERREREKVEDRNRRYYEKYPDAPRSMEDR